MCQSLVLNSKILYTWWHMSHNLFSLLEDTYWILVLWNHCVKLRLEEKAAEVAKTWPFFPRCFHSGGELEWWRVFLKSGKKPDSKVTFNFKCAPTSYVLKQPPTFWSSERQPELMEQPGPLKLVPGFPRWGRVESNPWGRCLTLSLPFTLGDPWPPLTFEKLDPRACCSQG